VTKRLCFIGDSHLACIRKAWDETSADATFFALPGRGMARIEVRDGTLSSGNPDVVRTLKLVSGGLERIDAAYDAYVLHAMHLGTAVALTLLRDMREVGAPAALVGRADFRAALRDGIESSIAVTTLRKLRAIARAPAVVSPTPLADTQFAALRASLVERGAAAALARLFAEECEAVCASLDARFVPQPPETLDADGLATRAEYARDAVRFADGKPSQDSSHMNARYGARVVAAVTAAL